MNLKIVNKTKEEVLFSNAYQAKSFIQRFKGLMFKEIISRNEAIMFFNTSSIHTFFMRFPIDVIFLNKKMKIVKIFKCLKPWRVCFCLPSYCAIECLGGMADLKGLKIEDQISIN
jgi:uncharacterized membrane protein (UPF0127 family)